MDITPTPSLVRYTHNVRGEAGRRWLLNLPNLVDHLAARWGLQVSDTHPGSGRSLVVQVSTRQGKPAVLKIEPQDAAGQIWAMNTFAAHSLGPNVLHHDGNVGASVIEWVDAPESEPDEASVCTIARSLSRVRMGADAHHSVPGAPEWGRQRTQVALDRMAGQQQVFPTRLLDDDMCKVGDNAGGVLLHGDLAPKNVLAAPGRLALIDPEPVIGRVEADLGKLCLRAAGGAQAVQLAQALLAATPDVDSRLLAWNICWSARTYVAYLADGGRPIPSAVLDLARQDAVDLT